MVRRCEKTAAGYLGFALFAAACQWLNGYAIRLLMSTLPQ